MDKHGDPKEYGGLTALLNTETNELEGVNSLFDVNSVGELGSVQKGKKRMSIEMYKDMLA